MAKPTKKTAKKRRVPERGRETLKLLLMKVETWHVRDQCWDVSFRKPTLREIADALLDAIKSRTT